MHSYRSLLLTICILGLGNASARAALIMSYEEAGSDVVGTLSGSLDLTGMSGSCCSFTPVANVAPLFGTFGTGPENALVITFFDPFASGPSSFGPGGQTGATSSSGSPFFFTVFFRSIAVPLGYANGDPLNATSTFTNATFSSLGLTPGEYVYTLGSGDTITIRTEQAAVPEPTTLSLLAFGLAGTGMAVRRRRQRKAT